MNGSMLHHTLCPPDSGSASNATASGGSRQTGKHELLITHTSGSFAVTGAGRRCHLTRRDSLADGGWIHYGRRAFTLCGHRHVKVFLFNTGRQLTGIHCCVFICHRHVKVFQFNTGRQLTGIHCCVFICPQARESVPI